MSMPAKETGLLSPQVWAEVFGGFFGRIKEQVTKPGGYTPAEMIADLNVSISISFPESRFPVP